MIPNFIKQKDETLYYIGEGEFIFFVPEEYFEKRCAIVEGEYVELIGILNYTILKEGEKDITKNLKTFNFPSKFMTRPNRIEKVKDIKLTSNNEDERYRLLYYTNNGVDEIVTSTKTPEEIGNVEDFFRLFVQTGNIPKTIPYNELHNYFLESIKLNGSSYKISAQLFGIIVSEICRDPDNMSNPFRLSEAINKDMNSYRSVSIKEIPRLISPFTAVTGENWDESVIGACLIDPKEAKSTPMERIMMD